MRLNVTRQNPPQAMRLLSNSYAGVDPPKIAPPSLPTFLGSSLALTRKQGDLRLSCETTCHWCEGLHLYVNAARSQAGEKEVWTIARWRPRTADSVTACV